MAAFAAEAATPTTGTLRGVVRDATGATLEGVRIVVTDTRVSTRRVALTNARGEYVVALLAPGDEYRLEAQLDGFGRVEKAGLRIPMGVDVSLNIAMQPALVSTLVVVSDTPLIGVTSTTTSTAITRDQLDALPSRRDFQRLSAIAPGVIFDRGGLSPTFGGSTHLENDYVIEGLSTRSIYDGSSATNLTINFVDEIQVIRGGLSAEYGRTTGGVLNVLTRSGTNEFNGGAQFHFTDAAWSSERVTSSSFGTEKRDAGHDTQQSAAYVGGPIRRDHAWFFGALELRRDESPIHLLDQSVDIDRFEDVTVSEDVYSAKLTAATSERQYLTFSAFGNPTDREGWLFVARSDPAAALRTEQRGSRNLSGRFQATLGSRWALELLLGEHRENYTVAASTDAGRTVPLQRDVLAAWWRGGFAQQGRKDARRRTFELRGSTASESHHVQAGLAIEKNRYDDLIKRTEYIYFGPRDVCSFPRGTDCDPAIGTRDVLWEQAWDFDNYGTNDGLAIFVQDGWQLARDVVVNLGLRWERQELSGPDGVLLAVGRNEDGTLDTRAADAVVFDGWAPRIGIAWDPGGRGRARVYAFAGRYYESIPLAINLYALNGDGVLVRRFYSTEPHTSDDWYNTSGSPLTGEWKPYASYESRGGVAFPFDANTRLQYDDELSVGAEAQVGAAWVLGVRLVARRLGDVIDDHSVFDPNDPMSEVDYVIGNPGKGSFGRELSVPKRRYQALELSAQRYLTNGWQLIASFTTARARGNYDGLYEYFKYNSSPNTGYQFDHPRSDANAFGKLRSDKPYQLKVFSSWEANRRLTLAGAFAYSSGVPISAFWRDYYPVRLLPRGSSGRTPDVWTLDFHGEWVVPVALRSRLAMSLVVDAFNVTDNHAAVDVDEVYAYGSMPGGGEWLAPDNVNEWGVPRYDASLPHSEWFGTPTVYQAPRSLQLGVRMAF